MNILLFGKNGQVGWELQRALSPLGTLTAVDRHAALCGDLSNVQGIEDTIHAIKPDIVVNAAAYTAVDKAESEKELAKKINVEAPKQMALACAKTKSLLVHYSSDYVFNGSGTRAWLEADKPAPLNYYGQSKLEGEQAIMAAGCPFLILRTSWVYAARGQNFIKTILKLARERSSINIVADQIGAPTGADLLADVSALAIKAYRQNPKLEGLYHLAPQGETNWHAYAAFIIQEAVALGFRPILSELNPIPSQDYQTAAQRPLNSRLNCTKFQEAFGVHLDHWQTGVRRAIQEISG